MYLRMSGSEVASKVPKPTSSPYSTTRRAEIIVCSLPGASEYLVPTRYFGVHLGVAPNNPSTTPI
jgi:hypothetical protein